MRLLAQPGVRGLDPSQREGQQADRWLIRVGPDLEVTRVFEVDDLGLVTGVWSFNGTGPDGEPVRLAANNADVLRRQTDGSRRFVIDNPWGTD